MSRARRLFAPMIIAGLTVVLAMPLLLVNTGDSYSCRGSAIVDLFHPEAQESALFRHDFFDIGRQCNRQAREQAATAGVLLVAGFGLSTAWAARRRTTRSGPSD